MTTRRRLFEVSFAAAVAITVADWAVIYGIVNHQRAPVHLGFFGSLLFPFLVLGYWALYKALESASPRLALALLLIGSYLATISTLIQGSTGLIEDLRLHAGSLSLASDALFGEVWSRFKVPLYVLGLVLTVAESALFAVVAWRRLGGYSRWLLLGNRLTTTLLCLLAAPLLSGGAIYLRLLSPNLSHVFLFLLLALHERQRGASGVG
jgi:hypothetical protein